MTNKDIPHTVRAITEIAEAGIKRLAVNIWDDAVSPPVSVEARRRIEQAIEQTMPRFAKSHARSLDI